MNAQNIPVVAFHSRFPGTVRAHAAAGRALGVFDGDLKSVNSHLSLFVVPRFYGFGRRIGVGLGGGLLDARVQARAVFGEGVELLAEGRYCCSTSL